MQIKHRPNFAFIRVVFLATGLLLLLQQLLLRAEPIFDGSRSAWHGFTRYDYIINDQTLTITSFKAPTNEGDGIAAPPPGMHRCVVVVPNDFAPGNPWSWRGCYWNHEPQAEMELLKHGFCITYISADAALQPGKEWDAWYSFLVRHGLSPKPAFIGMSRGGQYSYIWATAHPGEVSCVYGDNPYLPPPLLMQIGILATNDVPLLHVCGSLDPLLKNCSLAAEQIYQQFGGQISLMIKEGFSHHPHSLPDPTPIVNFILQSVYRTNAPSPAFVGKNYVKTSFYATESSFKPFPKDEAYITCRGPMFEPCYDYYQFGISNFFGGGVTVIVPHQAAAGNPWVFRTDYVSRNDAVDLELLAEGFHIVTGPVPYANGPRPEELDATYNYLVHYGFSKKPVLEGNGAAAGEVCAWAMANPEDVSCIYGKNLILHSNLSKIRLFDNLDILARANIPLICVGGDLDPTLNDNTVVIQQRYEKLGGKILVVLEHGEGHSPITVKDPQQVVRWICKSIK